MCIRDRVELAQYEYLLPRLTRMWTHLERQRGGIGMRGPGETEIETDRRIIRDRISLLKEKLKTIDKQMSTQRQNRGKMVRVALAVSYTHLDVYKRQQYYRSFGNDCSTCLKIYLQ